MVLLATIYLHHELVFCKGTLAAKGTIHGSHSWSGGPSIATQFAADDPGTSCGGDPDHLRHDISHDRLLDIDIIATYVTYNHALYLFELRRHNN